MARALVLIASTASALSLSSLQGVDAPKLRIGDNARGVRGLIATENIKQGEQLIAAPRASALETTSLEAKNAPRELKRAGYCDDAGWQQAGWQGRLALRLLKARKDESDLRGWFDALPASYDELPVVSWTDADLSDCAYAPLREVVVEQRKRWKKAEDALLPSSSFTQKDLRWALATVLTRSFSGPLEASSPTQRLATVGFAAWLAGGYVVGGYGPWETALQGFLAVALATLLSDYFVAKNDDLNLERHVLAPGVDFLNHAGVVEGGASYEYFGDQFAVRAHDDLRTGDEAFASYGAKSNALLLANYGFVEADNPNDDYVFPAQYPFPPLRGARVTRTGFDETVAKAAVSYSGSQDAARENLAKACRSQAAALENADGPLAELSREHAKVLSALAGATEASGGGL